MPVMVSHKVLVPPPHSNRSGCAAGVKGHRWRSTVSRGLIRPNRRYFYYFARANVYGPWFMVLFWNDSDDVAAPRRLRQIFASPWSRDLYAGILFDCFLDFGR
jgi:hypothetical protein